jgi:hypothetical protein
MIILLWTEGLASDILQNFIAFIAAKEFISSVSRVDDGGDGLNSTKLSIREVSVLGHP